MRGIADDCNAKAWQKKGGNCLALGRACPWSGGWMLQVRLRGRGSGYLEGSTGLEASAGGRNSILFRTLDG